MTSELKPCPHCNVELQKCTYNNGKTRWAHPASECINSRRFIYEHQRTSWNHRPVEAEIIEALKDMIEAHNYAFPDVDSLLRAQEKALSRANSIIQKAEGK